MSVDRFLKKISAFVDEKWIDGLLITAASVIVYSLSLGNGFVFDDIGVILNEPRIRDLRESLRFFTEGFLPGVEKGQGLQYYRPLVGVLHALEYQAFGPNPLGYKAFNLILNALLSLGVWICLRQVVADRLSAFLAALLWAVLPLRTEVVYWIYSDSYLLVGLFGFGAFWLFLRGKDVAANCCFAAALLCQESAVMLPLVFAVFGLQRFGFRQAFVKTSPMIVLTSVYLLLRWQVVGGIKLSPVSFVDWANGCAFVSAKALRTFLWPEAPATIYLYHEGMFRSVTPTIVAGYCWLLFCFFLACYWARDNDKRLSWLAWFWILLLPGLNVGATADYVFAEKAIFLASLGPCVLIGEQVARARSRNVIVSLFMVVVLIYGVKNITRAAAWKDTLSYLSTVTTFEPRSPMFQVVIGDILYEKGENEKSLEHYLLAHKFYPDSAKVKIKLTKGYLDLGYFALENGDTVKAEASFLAALKYDGSNYGAAEALLKLYLVQNRYEEAEQFLNAYLSFLGEIPLSLSKIQAELAKAPRLVKKGHD